MPAYNSADYIADAVESVLAQTYANWTLYISDDGSDDDTLQIANQYADKDERIQIVKSLEKSTGAAKTRNRALIKSKGDYIAFLDSDDIWGPEKLEKQIQFMQQHALALSCTKYSTIDEAGNPLGRPREGSDVLTYKDLLAHRGTIGCLTVMYDRNKCGDIQMPDIRKRQDYAMWLSILKQGHVSHRLNEDLASYRIREGSVSRNKLSAALYMWKVYRDVEKLGLLQSAYYFTHYAIYHAWGILKI